MRSVNFVNKAAAQRKIDAVEQADKIEKLGGSREEAGSIHGSGYWSNLEKSHDSLDSKNPSQKTNNTKDNSEKAAKGKDSNFQDKFHFEIIDNEQEKRIPAHMIAPNSLCKLFWNILIMILAVYTAILLPIRLAFMDESNIGPFVFYFDLFMDVAFIIDIVLNFFFVEEDTAGEMIIDQKQIAKQYLKRWFFVDLIASIPVSIILLLVQTAEFEDGIISIRFLKLTKFTRLYRLLTLFKMLKLVRDQKKLEILLSYLHLSHDGKQIISSLIRMVFLLHIVGCSFALVAVFAGQEHMVSWISALGISNASVTTRYIAACYWAVVTISTVGYGDITPTNETEVLMTIILVFIGVSMYSYIISRLTSIFAIVKNSKNALDFSREKVLGNFISKQRLDIQLSQKVMHFFHSSQVSIIHMTKDYRIDQLLDILPTFLKSEVTYYLFKQAIDVVKVFQDKDQRFYGEYLSKFEPMRLAANTCFVEEGSLPQAVYFLLSGSVQKDSKLNQIVGAKNSFLIEGSIFGETDLMKNRMRSESYITATDCYLLKITKALFKEIMDEFEDFREEVEAISNQREWMRLARIQAYKLGVDEETLIGQHAIDKENTKLMEERLEREAEVQLTDRAQQEKLDRFKQIRQTQIEVFFTLRDSHKLGISDFLLATQSPLIVRSASTQENKSPFFRRRQTSSTSLVQVQQKEPTKHEKQQHLRVQTIQEQVKLSARLVASSHDSVSAATHRSNISNRSIHQLINPAKKDKQEFLEGGQKESNALVRKQTLTFVEDKDTEVTQESIHNLGQRIKVCNEHLQYGKLLIQNYRTAFKDEINSMRHGDQLENELHIRNYEKGVQLLSAYYSVMLHIEQNLAVIDLETLLREILETENETLQIRQQYYLLEGKVNQIMGQLAQKMTSLNQEKNSLLVSASLDTRRQTNRSDQLL